ncbi:hypothetical protein SynBOUM118_02128 [Synechococcus sp. BOUM118]|nr:hypothetical protein SynBOUM118_02128 [Synechococcus sp. BOUM118]
MPTKGPTQVIFETVGAGARKSVSYCDLLGWSFVCHGASDRIELSLCALRAQSYRH